MSGGRTAAQQALFEASGSVALDGKLECFLYLLMRDHLPPGVVADLMQSLGAHTSATFTNGWLARYAEHVAQELRQTSAVATAECPFCTSYYPKFEPKKCPVCHGKTRLPLSAFKPGLVADRPCPNGCFRGYDPHPGSNKPCHCCNDPARGPTARP